MASLLLLKSLLYIKRYQKKKTKNSNLMKSKMSDYQMSIICRICCNETGTVSIFNNILQPNIAEEIQNFTGVIIQESDVLSTYLCQNCLNLLNGSIKFRDMCRRNNKDLLDIKTENSEVFKNKDILEASNGKHADENVDNNDDNCYRRSISSPTLSEDFNNDENIYGCATCRETYNDLESYNMHLPSCNTRSLKHSIINNRKTKKSFLCDICGKTLTTVTSLTIHRNTHRNIFPYKCELCSYRGRTIDLLRVHKRIHLTEKPYKCALCPQTSTTSSNLKRHVKYVHNNERPHKCSFCDSTFRYQSDVDKHIREIHLRQDATDCPICHKNFATRKIMRGHRLKVHKIKGERSGRLPAYLRCQNSHQSQKLIELEETNYLK